MNVNGVNNSHTPAVPQKSDVKTQISAQGKNATAMPRDKYERSQIAAQYSTYSSSGVTAAQPSAAQAKATENNAPDITANYFWEDPRRQETIDVLEKVFGGRAQESLRTSNPFHHAWQRYFDPSARHFVGHDLTDWERQEAFMDEMHAVRFFQDGKGLLLRSIHFANPIFEGRGLGSSDPNVPRRNIDDFNAHRVDATWRFQQRNNITRQLMALFSNNGVFVPENTRLRFIIDSDYNLRVEGTDDKDLISRIEELLNRNGNARELFLHISGTRQPGSTQFNEDSYRLWQLSSAIEDYTGLNLRRDLELVNGRFITEDGTSVIELLEEHNTDPFIIAWIIGELSWLADRGGAENIPEMELSIDFENGNLFCVGQENGFGPGQTGWIDELPGTDAPGVRDYA